MKKLIVINILLMFLLSVLPVSEQKTEQINTEVNSNEQIISSRGMEIREEIVTEEPRIENKPINISKEGINLIKKYEGLKTKSYRLEGEKYYTIGYGHSGSDVKEGQVISKEEAERLLMADLQGYVNLVLEKCAYLDLTQNQLDALVSFTYNGGLGMLNQLTANGTRSAEEIAEKILNYTKSSSEANRKGLEKRRLEEQKLFKGE